MNYLYFSKKTDFDKWHVKVKKALDLPRVGHKAAETTYKTASKTQAAIKVEGWLATKE